MLHAVRTAMIMAADAPPMTLRIPGGRFVMPSGCGAPGPEILMRIDAFSGTITCSPGGLKIDIFGSVMSPSSPCMLGTPLEALLRSKDWVPFINAYGERVCLMGRRPSVTPEATSTAVIDATTVRAIVGDGVEVSAQVRSASDLVLLLKVVAGYESDRRAAQQGDEADRRR